MQTGKKAERLKGIKVKMKGKKTKRKKDKTN